MKRRAFLVPDIVSYAGQVQLGVENSVCPSQSGDIAAFQVAGYDPENLSRYFEYRGLYCISPGGERLAKPRVATGLGLYFNAPVSLIGVGWVHRGCFLGASG